MPDLRLPVEVEGEDGFGHGILRDERVEHRPHSIDRDARVRHAEDSVEPCSNERETRLIGCFRKGLILGRRVSNLWPQKISKRPYLIILKNSLFPKNPTETYCDNVGAEESCQTSGAVLDREGGSVLFVGARLAAVVLLMKYYKRSNRLHYNTTRKYPGITSVNLRQAMSVRWQLFEGTHRLDEPVSKTTRKVCGGVPIVISP